jgi:cytochrome c5
MDLTRRLVVTVTVAIGITFIAAGIYAGTEVKDEIKMENKAYKKHKESIQTWSHKKHATEYAEKHPDLYSSPCGECHHEDKDGKSVPLLSQAKKRKEWQKRKNANIMQTPSMIIAKPATKNSTRR